MVRFLLTLLLNAIIIFLIGVFIYIGVILYEAYTTDKDALNQIADPRVFIKRILERKEVWDVYQSKSYTFEHPKDWHPKVATLQGDGGEVIDLQIPEIFSIVRVGSKNIIGYSKSSISEMRPQNLKSETDFIMLERRGFKWIYTKEKMTVYEYAVELNTDTAVLGQRLSFILSVESIRENKDLEAKLDRIASSVKKKETNF